MNRKSKAECKVQEVQDSDKSPPPPPQATTGPTSAKTVESAKGRIWSAKEMVAFIKGETVSSNNLSSAKVPKCLEKG